MMNKKAAAATLAIITIPVIYIGLMVHFGGELVIGWTLGILVVLCGLMLIVGGIVSTYQHFVKVFPE